MVAKFLCSGCLGFLIVIFGVLCSSRSLRFVQIVSVFWMIVLMCWCIFIINFFLFLGV